MRNLKATPGPWFLINDWCVGGPIEPEWKEAGCGIAHCGMRARTPEEARSNARLIAAAPELYDALQSVIELIDNGVIVCAEEHMLSVAIDEFREGASAALAKARGETA